MDGEELKPFLIGLVITLIYFPSIVSNDFDSGHNGTARWQLFSIL